MAEARILDSWKGQGVMLKGSMISSEHGTLEEVNEFGIVVSSSIGVEWGGYDEQGQPKENRTLSMFYPWHLVHSLRLQEPEERQEHGGE